MRRLLRTVQASQPELPQRRILDRLHGPLWDIQMRGH